MSGLLAFLFFVLLIVVMFEVYDNDNDDFWY